MKRLTAVPSLFLAGMLGAILAGALPDASAQVVSLADPSIAPGCPTEKVTAAGWFPTPFAKEPKTRDIFNIKVSDCASWPLPVGTVEYTQNRTPTRPELRVQSTEIQVLSVTGNTALIFGTCTVNGAPGYKFSAELVDNGNSAASPDTLSFLVEGAVWTPPTPLAGGTITVKGTALGQALE